MSKDGGVKQTSDANLESYWEELLKMQKDGEPVWDQTTIDRLWVTTQREAMIESAPPGDSGRVATVRRVRAESAEGADEKVGEVATKQTL